MTRRKWTRLRRQRPELFRNIQENAAFEKISKTDWKKIRLYSRAETIAALTAHQLKESCE